MIRQAHSYLTGAASSAGLVAAAIVGFVLLVWINPLHGVTLPSLGFGPDTVTPTSQRSIAPAAHRGGAPGGAVPRRAAARHGSTQAGAGSAKKPGRSGESAGGQGATTHGDVAGNPGAASTPQGSGRGDQGPQVGGSSGASDSSGVQVGDTPVNSTTAANAANGAVDTAGQAAGGALGQTGATGAAHGVIDSTVGPGSTAGGAVDGAVGAVGGALGSPGGR